MGPIHKGRAPWKELKRDINIKWEPGTAGQYTEPSVFPLAGPSQNIVEVKGYAESLAFLFVSIIPLSFFQQVEKQTNEYAYKDWVLDKTVTDQDGNLNTNKYASNWSVCTDGVKTPGQG